MLPLVFRYTLARQKSRKLFVQFFLAQGWAVHRQFARQVQLATWLDGDYTYSIGIYREDGTGLTADEMTGLVKAAK